MLKHPATEGLCRRTMGFPGAASSMPRKEINLWLLFLYLAESNELESDAQSAQNQLYRADFEGFQNLHLPIDKVYILSILYISRFPGLAVRRVRLCFKP